MEYSHNFGSNYPISVIDIGTKNDIDNTVASLISQYYQYINANNIDGANQFYNDNKNVLEAYSVNCNDWNRLEEEIYNTGMFSLDRFTVIVSDTEPEYQTTNSHWLQEW